MKSIYIMLLTGMIVLKGTGQETRPGMFLNIHEIDSIKAAVSAGRDPWKTAYDQMIQDADKALGQQPLSVTFQGDNGNE
jgi:hypothetical protein